jgi:DNA-binding winged helix-turn-helix (wHTH) protein
MDAENPPCMVYRFDRFTLNLARGALLTSDGAELPLRPKSFALLQFLVENAGRLLDRDTIMQAIWPDVFVTDDSITQCVRDIRRVLGDESQRLLRTLPRRGYLFNVAVSCASPATAVVDELPWRSAGQFTVPTLPLLPFEDEEASPRPALEAGRTGRDNMPEELIGHPHPGGVPGSAPRLPVTDSDVDRSSSGRLSAPNQTEPIGFLSSPGTGRRQMTVLFCDLVH